MKWTVGLLTVVIFSNTTAAALAQSYSNPLESIKFDKELELPMPSQTMVDILKYPDQKKFELLEWQGSFPSHRQMLPDLLSKLPGRQRDDLHRLIGHGPSMCTVDKNREVFLIDQIRNGSSRSMGFEVEFKDNVVQKFRIIDYPEGGAAQKKYVTRWYEKVPALSTIEEADDK